MQSHRRDPFLETSDSSVVIVAKDKSCVRGTMNFLNRRGIRATIVPGLAEAIEVVVRKKADVVLLSVNIPHASIDRIPALIERSFNVPCIVFAENGDRGSVTRLNSCHARHSIFGPVSGPVVLRQILAIDREYGRDKNHQYRSPEAMKELFSVLSSTTPGEKEEPSEVIDNAGSIFQQCVQDALLVVCGSIDGKSHGMQSYGSPVLLSIENRHVHGSALIVTGDSNRQAEDAIRRIEVAIAALLKKGGIELDPSEVSAVPVGDSELARKVFESSDNTLVSLGELEAGIAILKAERVVPFMEPFEHRLLKILCEDIKPEVRVPCDVFLHMPANGKFLKYLREGSKLSRNQFESLERKNVRHLFVPEEKERAYRSYHGENILREVTAA
jgi:DNA-binding response OmpR family regulator